MPLSNFDANTQLKIMETLADHFPFALLDSELTTAFVDEVEKFKFNLIYLMDKGFVTKNIRQDSNGREAKGYRLTASGVDHLRM